MIKLVHAADFHLDSPFEGLSGEEAALRRKEQRMALSDVFRLTASENADLLLLAGDIFEGQSAYRETTELLEGLLRSCEARVFIAPGNHDYWSPNSPLYSLELPENVHIFTSQHIERIPLPELGCAVYGAAFTSQLCMESLLTGFSAKDDGLMPIMVLHGDLKPGEQRYNPVSEADIQRSGLKYLALGHNHSFSGVLTAGETVYACPGCPLGRAFDEPGQKGVIVAQLDKDVEARFAPLKGRRYESVTVSLSGEDSALRQAMAALPKSGTKNDIYRLIFTGQAPRSGVDEQAVLSALEDNFYRLSVIDRSRPYRDLWQSAGEDTLKGMFLSQLKTQLEQAESDEERARIELAARYGLAALENGEEPHIC